MSRGSLQDTVTDLEVVPPAEPPVWNPVAALGWTAALGVTVGGGWFGSFFVCRYVWLLWELDAELAGGRAETVALYGVGGAVIGLCIAGLVLVRRPTRARLLEALGVAAATGIVGAICPLFAHAVASWLPPLGASTLVWTAAGAVIGLGGYTWGRGSTPVKRGAIEAAGEAGSWSVTGAAGWATAMGVSCAGMWLIELALLRLLPDPVRLGRLVATHVYETAGVFALFGGVIGFAVGMLSGLLVGRPPRLAAGLYRGVGFANAAAVGGGLVPFVVSAASGWLSPEVSSTLVWAVVGAVAGAVGYGYSRREVRTGGPPDVEMGGVSVEPIPADRPVLTPLPPAPPGVLAGDGATPESVEEPVAVLAGWDRAPEESLGRGSPARILPVPPTDGGAVVRVGPVLLVSAGCLLAVGLSAPSPVGWSMLAIGLLGLAVAWGLAGQERRIRELEGRLREAAPAEQSAFRQAP